MERFHRFVAERNALIVYPAALMLAAIIGVGVEQAFGEEAGTWAFALSFFAGAGYVSLVKDQVIR